MYISQKKRLMDLLLGKSIVTDAELNSVVNHLIENGVKVVPCQEGDTVYQILRSQQHKNYFVNMTQITEIRIERKGIVCKCIDNTFFFVDSWGETVFGTPEETEKALKELQGNHKGMRCDEVSFIDILTRKDAGVD